MRNIIVASALALVFAQGAPAVQSAEASQAVRIEYAGPVDAVEFQAFEAIPIQMPLPPLPLPKPGDGGLPPGPGPLPLPQFGGPSPLVIADQVINIGIKLWNVIKDNMQSYTEVTAPVAHAMPQGITHWTQLVRFSDPKGDKYKIAVGDDSVGEFVVWRRTNGAVKLSGKYVGKYLANVTFTARAQASSGWKFTMNCVADEPTNVGDDEDPIGALRLTVNVILKRWFWQPEVRNSFVFNVRGDGKFEMLDGPVVNGQGRHRIDKVGAALKDLPFALGAGPAGASVETLKGVGAAGW